MGKLEGRVDKVYVFMEGIVQSAHSPVQTTLFQEARVFGQ